VTLCEDYPNRRVFVIYNAKRHAQIAFHIDNGVEQGVGRTGTQPQSANHATSRVSGAAPKGVNA